MNTGTTLSFINTGSTVVCRGTGKREAMAPAKKVPPEWSKVKALLHLRIQDAAISLGVSESYLKIYCRKNGIPRWPGQRIRALMDHLQKLGMEAAARQRAPPGEEAGYRLQVLIAKDISEVIEEMSKLLQITDPPPGLQYLSGNSTTAVTLQADGVLSTDSGADA